MPAAAKGGDMDKTEHSDLGAPRTGNTPRPESRWVPPPCDMTILCDHRSTPSRAEILGAQAYETITNTRQQAVHDQKRLAEKRSRAGGTRSPEVGLPELRPRGGEGVDKA